LGLGFIRRCNLNTTREKKRHQIREKKKLDNNRPSQFDGRMTRGMKVGVFTYTKLQEEEEKKEIVIIRGAFRSYLSIVQTIIISLSIMMMAVGDGERRFSLMASCQDQNGRSRERSLLPELKSCCRSI
jgi:hypothetical protein